MAEETINPAETAPVQETPVQAAPAQAAPTTSEPPAPAAKKGDFLLTLLTVLLVLVGIADVALWGVAGYYFLLG